MNNKRLIDNTIEDPRGNRLMYIKNLYERLGYNVQIKSKPVKNLNKIVSNPKKDQE